MSDAQAIGNKGYLTELDVRAFLRDTKPEANLLLDDYEYGPEEIRQAMTMAVDTWNDTPPDLIRHTVESFPYRRILLLGAVANLLTMAGMMFRRNRLPYQIAGGSVDDQNKAPDYDRAAADLAKQFTTMLQAKKLELNIDQGWGTDG